MRLLDILRDRLSLVPRKPGACLWDSFVPGSMSDNEDLLRRARLQIRFGWLGAIFGSVYATFYMLIGHWHGAEIIVTCSTMFACGPWLLKKTANLRLTGHLYAAVLLAGFSALCSLEGGLHGHAIAWLAAVPLCVLLLLKLKHAVVWVVLCFLTAVTFGALEIAGIHCPKAYPPEHDDLISAAGYAGLVCFMSLLGITFERLRARSFQQMEKALAALSLANQRLVKVNLEKDEFMKIAAHDLKNPLCGISGYAEILMMVKSPTPQQIAETSRTIRGLSQRMLDIVTNLLDVRRIEEGSMEFKLGRYAVEPLLQGIIKDHSHRAEKKQMSLIMDVVETVPLQMLADEGVVQQILDNLISNAVKYSPPGTTVHCSYREEDTRVFLEIRDEGPGLSDEDKGNLFKKFSRLTPRPTGGEESHGLGLWIVQRMAKSMGGDVQCESALGKGSTFSLVLPKWNPETAAAPAHGMPVVAKLTQALAR